MRIQKLFGRAEVMIAATASAVMAYITFSTVRERVGRRCASATAARPPRMSTSDDERKWRQQQQQPRIKTASRKRVFFTHSLARSLSQSVNAFVANSARWASSLLDTHRIAEYRTHCRALRHINLQFESIDHPLSCYNILLYRLHCSLPTSSPHAFTVCY